ncbi:hypothetical protein K439DRAFT_1619730 [Ramaria rubella]|nr:hypothetical protein K439DRAFT_1619730 [Ramaria rubella]
MLLPLTLCCNVTPSSSSSQLFRSRSLNFLLSEGLADRTVGKPSAGGLHHFCFGLDGLVKRATSKFRVDAELTVGPVYTEDVTAIEEGLLLTNLRGGSESAMRAMASIACATQPMLCDEASAKSDGSKSSSDKTPYEVAATRNLDMFASQAPFPDEGSTRGIEPG